MPLQSYLSERLADKAKVRELEQCFEVIKQLSPLYSKIVQQDPELLLWADDRVQSRAVNDFRAALLADWDKNMLEPMVSRDVFLRKLQMFRRKWSFLVIFQDLCYHANVPDLLHQLSQLAKWCIQQAGNYLFEVWTQRLGIPWDVQKNQPASYCVFALGKLGANELNFCSDVDLMYMYEGKGQCLRDEALGIANEEFFARFFQDLTRFLQERSPCGFLYNVDLRLRPGGGSSPIVHSYQYYERYYQERGQVWERFAWIKASAIYGNINMGKEFLDEMNAFRYPRYAPSSLVQEIAELKSTIAKELQVQESTYHDIKNGYGGIREIEFIVQACQLLHGGKTPFIQSTSTIEAITQLHRYAVINIGDLRILKDAYLFLRRLENHIQMQEEIQTHQLPQDEVSLSIFSVSMGFENLELFKKYLRDIQDRVHALYLKFFPEDDIDEQKRLWFSFLNTGTHAPSILIRWFSDDDAGIKRFWQFFGSKNIAVDSQYIHMIEHLLKEYDDLRVDLASPNETFFKLIQFGSLYSTIKQFLKTIQLNPSVQKSLSYLFDRSEFIYGILHDYPEIVEELLHEAPNRLKSYEDYCLEIKLILKDKKWDFLLWLYVKSEQIRLSIAQLLHGLSWEVVEAHLAILADACIGSLALRHFSLEGLSIVALGSYGVKELPIGSDLDLLFIGDCQMNRGVHSIVQHLQYNPLRGPMYPLDLRLRPHGQDGPMISSINQLEAYFSKKAQLWEVQALTRARCVVGNPVDVFLEKMLNDFIASKTHDYCFKEVWSMRQRVEASIRSGKVTVGDWIKKSQGGLWDVDFYLQALQLSSQKALKSFRGLSSLSILRSAEILQWISSDEQTFLLEHYAFMKKLNFYLKRYFGADGLKNIFISEYCAYWFGFSSKESFENELSVKKMKCRELIEKLFNT